MRKIVLILIRTYQYLLSPWVGQHCRFWPGCSTYTYEAVQRHGVGVGLLLGLKRLARCHPWSHGGIDLVPLKKID